MVPPLMGTTKAGSSYTKEHLETSLQATEEKCLLSVCVYASLPPSLSPYTHTLLSLTILALTQEPSSSLSGSVILLPLK